jgi:hypothetical protein
MTGTQKDSVAKTDKRGWQTPRVSRVTAGEAEATTSGTRTDAVYS